MKGADIIFSHYRKPCRELLLSQCLLDGLGKFGNDLVEVAYDTVVCYVEDGSILILVDSDDDV